MLSFECNADYFSTRWPYRSLFATGSLSSILGSGRTEWIILSGYEPKVGHNLILITATYGQSESKFM